MCVCVAFWIWKGRKQQISTFWHYSNMKGSYKQVKWWHLWCFWWNAMNDMRFTIKVYIVYVLYMYMRCLSRLMNVQFGCGNENACKYFIVIVLVVSQWFATKEVISKYLSFSMQNSLVSPFFSFVLWKDSFSWRECKRKRLFK